MEETRCCARADESDRAATATGRIVALDRARTFITLLVLIHHSAVNYTHFGNGDKMRWLGFDLVVLFNDSFFMACMFLISGLFVHDSLTRRGAADFLRDRAWRLGIPFLVSIFVLMPIAYYPIFLRYHHARHHRFQFLPLSGGARSPSGHGRRDRHGSCGCCSRSTSSPPRSGRWRRRS